MGLSLFPTATIGIDVGVAALASTATGDAEGDDDNKLCLVLLCTSSGQAREATINDASAFGPVHFTKCRPVLRVPLAAITGCHSAESVAAMDDEARVDVGDPLDGCVIIHNVSILLLCCQKQRETDEAKVTNAKTQHNRNRQKKIEVFVWGVFLLRMRG
jgi:hypothetical protein